MPFVRAALANDPRLIVDYRSRPGDGTEVNLVDGDPATFDRRIRGAIDQANQ
jgi:hypothetical protein